MYSYDFSFPHTPGRLASLTASVVNRAGIALVSQPVFTFVEDDNGYYAAYTDEMPDGQYGRVKILDTGVVIAVGGVSPSESELGSKINRLLGLSKDNWVLDDTTYDARGNLTAGIIYVYDSAANATLHDKATGLIYRYNVTGIFSGSNMTRGKNIRSL